jgi:HisJ family histidinol phosphate phosphatase
MKHRKIRNPIFFHDFHVHTSYSDCAKIKSEAAPNRMINQAEKLGIKTIGFTDHFAQFPPYPTPKWANCGIQMIDSLRKDIKNIDSPIQILIGVEADVINPQKLSIDKTFASQLDYVTVSASHFHLPGIKKPGTMNVNAIAQHYLTMIKAALTFDYISVIAHPFKTPKNVFGSPNEYMDIIPRKDLYEIAEMAKQQQIAMEINGILGLDMNYFQAVKEFLLICKEIGVRFTYGSDAHHRKQLEPSPGFYQIVNELNLSVEDFLTPEELIGIHRDVYR